MTEHILIIAKRILQLNASTTALAAVFLIGSFWTGTVQRFVPMLAVGEFFLFIMQVRIPPRNSCSDSPAFLKL